MKPADQFASPDRIDLAQQRTTHLTIPSAKIAPTPRVAAAPSPGTASAAFPFGFEERVAPITDKEFDFIRQLAMTHAGISLADYKRNMVYRRVTKRLRALDLVHVADYCRLLADPTNAAEIAELINALTTNKTSFFREGHHFEHFAQVALPKIMERAALDHNRRLRVWSAGCSSGQEPYSLGMTLLDKAQKIAGWDVRILATDIDSDILAKAQAGVYANEEMKTVPPALMRAFVENVADDPEHHRIADRVRSHVVFKQLNLHEPWPMRGPFDAIFCRNVVIYFDKPTQCALFNRFADILRDGSYLYLGHSESLYKVSDRFRPMGQSVYQKTK